MARMVAVHRLDPATANLIVPALLALTESLAMPFLFVRALAETPTPRGRTILPAIACRLVSRTVAVLTKRRPTVTFPRLSLSVPQTGGGTNGATTSVGVEASLSVRVVSSSRPPTCTGLMTVPTTSARTTTVIVTTWPGAIVPMSQVIGPVPVQVPCVELTDTNVTWSIGSGSVTTTLVADCVPAFFTVIVYVMFWPTVTGSGSSVFVTIRLPIGELP